MWHSRFMSKQLADKLCPRISGKFTHSGFGIQLAPMKPGSRLWQLMQTGGLLPGVTEQTLNGYVDGFLAGFSECREGQVADSLDFEDSQMSMG